LNTKVAPNLREDPIPQLLRQLTMPISIGLIFSTLLNATDTFYASWYSVEAAAAVALTAPVMFLMIAFGIGIGRATFALVGRSLGAGELDMARRLALQALSLTVLASILISVVAALFLPQLFGGLDSGTLFDLAVSYVHPILAAAPLFGLPIVINAVLTTHGMPTAYRNAQIAAFAANMVLDPLFMYGFGMGVRGIAMASVVTQLGAVIYLTIKLAELDHLSGPWLREMLPDRIAFIGLAKQAVPTSASMLVIALSNILIIGFVGRFGSDALAGYGIAWRVEQICLLPLVGLMQAVSSTVGVNYGAKNGNRVGQTLLHGYRLALTMALPMLVVLLTCHGMIMQLFSDNATVRAIGAGYLQVLAITVPSYAVVYNAAAVMQGLGRPTLALGYNLLRLVLLTGALSGIALYVIGTEINGIWWAICIANWASAAIMWSHIRRIQRA
jgi:putative MATE family efflux protein